MMLSIFLQFLLLSLQSKQGETFGGLTAHCSALPYVARSHIPIIATRLHSTNSPLDADDVSSEDNEEGVALAADFFKILGERNIQLSEEDFIDDDDDDDEDDDDDKEVDDTGTDSKEEEDEEEDDENVNIPEGAINAFVDFDEKSENVTLTNEQVYSELKERVLESAGSFIDLVGGAEDDGNEDDSNEDDDENEEKKVYVPPTTVPDPALTAGEVVTVVLDALLHNDVPSRDSGIEVLFEYSSPGSAISQAIEVDGMTPSEYGEFLKEEDNEYRVLFDHMEVIIDKGDYSFDRKKAFFTARLRVGTGPLDFTGVNFILSTNGEEEDDCWLVDSLLIRPEGMRRRRRR